MMLPASSLAIELSAARGVRVIRCKSRKTKQTWPLLAVWMVLDANVDECEWTRLAQSQIQG